MKPPLRRVLTGSIRSCVIYLGVLAASITGAGISSSTEVEIGMPQQLSITHQPPSTVEPWLDLVLSFSVSGDCEGDPPGAYALGTPGPPGTISPRSGLEVGRCGPLTGAVTYDSGTGPSTVAATFALRDLQGFRAGTVTIPGSELPSGATLTYTITSRQSRTYFTTEVGVPERGCLVELFNFGCAVHGADPYVFGPSESGYIATASRSATIRISGN